MHSWQTTLFDMPTQRTLYRAIESGDIDDRLLQHFSLDCAKRAVLSEYQGGQQPAWYTRILKCAWNTIQCKQRWLQEQDDTAELELWYATTIDLDRLAAELPEIDVEGILLFQYDAPQDPTERKKYVYFDEYPILSVIERIAGRESVVIDTVEVAADAVRIHSLDHPVAARDDEIQWQCLRLSWWLAFAQHTERLWLAFTPENPLPAPDESSLLYGFPRSFRVLFPEGKLLSP